MQHIVQYLNNVLLVMEYKPNIMKEEGIICT